MSVGIKQVRTQVETLWQISRWDPWLISRYAERSGACLCVIGIISIRNSANGARCINIHSNSGFPGKVLAWHRHDKTFIRMLDATRGYTRLVSIFASAQISCAHASKQTKWLEDAKLMRKRTTCICCIAKRFPYEWANRRTIELRTKCAASEERAQTTQRRIETRRAKLNIPNVSLYNRAHFSWIMMMRREVDNISRNPYQKRAPNSKSRKQTANISALNTINKRKLTFSPFLFVHISRLAYYLFAALACRRKFRREKRD